MATNHTVGNNATHVQAETSLVLSARDGEVFVNYQYNQTTKQAEPEPDVSKRAHVHRAQLSEANVIDTLDFEDNTTVTFAADGSTTLNVNGGTISNVPTPTDSDVNQAPNVQYVQDYVLYTSLLEQTKQPVDVVLDGQAITDVVAGASFLGVPQPARWSSGTFGVHTIQSIDMTLGRSILMRDNTDPATNGIYIVVQQGASVPTIWERRSDADTIEKLQQYSTVFVINGTYSGRTYRLDSQLTEMDVDAQVWAVAASSADSDIFEGAGISTSGRTVSVKLSTILPPGLVFDANNALRADGPTRYTTGYVQFMDGIQARFGSAGTAYIAHNGSGLTLTTTTSNQFIRLDPTGTSGEIQMGDNVLVRPTNVRPMSYRITAGNPILDTFLLQRTTTTTTYATLTRDGNALSTASTQTLVIPASTDCFVEVTILGLVTAHASSGDNGMTYKCKLSFNPSRTAFSGVQYLFENSNQDPVYDGLLILNESVLTEGSWIHPKVLANSSSAVDYVQIQVASPTANHTVQWRAVGTMVINNL